MKSFSLVFHLNSAPFQTLYHFHSLASIPGEFLTFRTIQATEYGKLPGNEKSTMDFIILAAFFMFCGKCGNEKIM